MEWWIWFAIGLTLLVSEIFVPLDFFMFFIGAAAILVGATSSVVDLELSMQLISFGVLSLVLLLTLRRPLMQRIKADAGDTGTNIEGTQVVIIADIAAGQSGKGEARGTSWTVRNLSAETLVAGQSYRVARRDGLALVVE